MARIISYARIITARLKVLEVLVQNQFSQCDARRYPDATSSSLWNPSLTVSSSGTPAALGRGSEVSNTFVLSVYFIKAMESFNLMRRL